MDLNTEMPPPTTPSRSLSAPLLAPPPNRRALQGVGQPGGVRALRHPARPCCCMGGGRRRQLQLQNRQDGWVGWGQDLGRRAARLRGRRAAPSNARDSPGGAVCSTRPALTGPQSIAHGVLPTKYRPSAPAPLQPSLRRSERAGGATRAPSPTPSSSRTRTPTFTATWRRTSSRWAACRAPHSTVRTPLVRRWFAPRLPKPPVSPHAAFALSSPA